MDRRSWQGRRESRGETPPGACPNLRMGALAPKNQKSARRRSFGSPSRFRFRPPFALTFGFRLRPSGSASSYLRSVLGARGNLGVRRSRHKRSRERKARNLDTPRKGRPLSRGSILVRMRPVSPNQFEPGQGALALRPADAPGGWGKTVAPTRSDRRQSERMALGRPCRRLGRSAPQSRPPQRDMSDRRARCPTQTSGENKI